MTGLAAAVLGSPIAHSLSPVLHRAAYAALGLDRWTYTAIECDEAGLPAVLATPGWAGLSLTMPLKRAVLPLLDRRPSRSPSRSAGPTRWCSRAASGSVTTPTCPAWSRPWPRPG